MTHDVSLPLRLRPVAVPRLVLVGVGLPRVLQHRVDERLADEDAQVDHQIGVHRPAEGDNAGLFFIIRPHSHNLRDGTPGT